jgi:hypothetical protein
MGPLIKRRIAPRAALLQGSNAQLKINYHREAML